MAFAFVLTLFSVLLTASAIVRSRSGDNGRRFAIRPASGLGYRQQLPQAPRYENAWFIWRRLANYQFNLFHRAVARPRYAAYGSGVRSRSSSSSSRSHHLLRSIRSATPPSFYPSAPFVGAPT